jgi:hypothetical protein
VKTYKLVQFLSNRKQTTEIKSYNATQYSYSSWATIKCGIHDGSILGPLLFVTKVNDLPSTLNTLPVPIIFVDKTSVIIYSKNVDDLCLLSNTALSLSHINNWFAANKLALNLNKTNIISFITNTSPQYSLNCGYNNKYISESVNTKFLCL